MQISLNNAKFENIPKSEAKNGFGTFGFANFYFVFTNGMVWIVCVVFFQCHILFLFSFP